MMAIFPHMRRFAATLLLILTVTAGTQAQGLQTLAGSTLVGSANGALLGIGTMALANTTDLAAVRVGIGSGTLYGLGIGAYDITARQVGSGYRVEGMFNSANYSAMIVLLDTFYGGLTGSIVGTALQLMADKPLIDGIQYGSGVGLWGGFVFGLADVFLFSDPVPMFGAVPEQSLPDQRVTVRVLQPTLLAAPSLQNGNAGLRLEPALDVARITIRF
jgi:hypothetical protein